MDGRKNNRGHANSGRKPKSAEIALIEKLTPYEDKALEVLKMKIEEGDMQAVKLFMEYLHGKPKQIIESDNTHTFNDFDLREHMGFKKKDDRTP